MFLPRAPALSEERVLWASCSAPGNLIYKVGRQMTLSCFCSGEALPLPPSSPQLLLPRETAPFPERKA